MAEFLKLSGGRYLNTDNIAGADDGYFLSSDGDFVEHEDCITVFFKDAVGEDDSQIYNGKDADALRAWLDAHTDAGTPAKRTVAEIRQARRNAIDQRLEDMVTELVAHTKDCRPDFHEPDEQGIYGRVVGDSLDNACIAQVRDVQDPTRKLSRAEVEADGDYSRYVDLALVLEDDKHTPFMVLNLADMIAAIRYLDRQRKQEAASE